MQLSSNSRDRIVVSTSRCGRDNPGSNPGHGISSCGVSVMAQLSRFFSLFFLCEYIFFFFVTNILIFFFSKAATLFHTKTYLPDQKHPKQFQSFILISAKNMSRLRVKF